MTTKPKNNTKHTENTKKQNKTIDLNTEKLVEEIIKIRAEINEIETDRKSVV